MSMEMRRDPGRGFTVASYEDNPAKNYTNYVQGLPGIDFLIGAHSGDALIDPDMPMEDRVKASNDMFTGLMAAVQSAVPDDVLAKFRIDTIQVPGCPEEPESECTLTYYVPPIEGKKLPLMLYATGGGMLAAEPRIVDVPKMALDFGCVIVAPHYRVILDGAHYPQALNDLHAGYAWMVEHAAELGGDLDSTLIFGQSAGSHQALCLAFRLKRYGFDMPRGVVLSEPILEDRPIYHSQQILDTMWHVACHHYVNMQYFGREFGSPLLGPEAFGNRATVEECKGLPPIFFVGSELDVQSDPVLAFASKAREAGTAVEIHQYAGMSHGMTATAGIGTRAEKMCYECVHEVIDNDLRRPWNADGWPMQ